VPNRDPDEDNISDNVLPLGGAKLAAKPVPESLRNSPKQDGLGSLLEPKSVKSPTNDLVNVHAQLSLFAASVEFGSKPPGATCEDKSPPASTQSPTGAPI
jgi:hypothetical protein